MPPPEERRDDGRESGPDDRLPQRRPVPVRTILATIGLVVATGVALYLVVQLARIEILLVVAGFFAVVLDPAVELVRRRLHVRRTLAALMVFLVGFALLAGALYSFIRPVIDEGTKFSQRFPRYVAEARAGRGPVGHLVKRYKLDRYVERNQTKIRQALTRASRGALRIARSIAVAIAELLTVFVLAFLMLIYGPDMLAGGLGMLSPPTRERVRVLSRDASRALTGYVFGNLLISVIAAVVVFVSLWILNVPFRGVLALFVAFADLIPLVGATIGAIPTIAVALLHSVTAGIVMLVVFVAYQQFENHVLQVVIMARTVRINQLVVLVSALVGASLLGIVGALLAIPAAGVIQVVARNLYEERRLRRAAPDAPGPPGGGGAVPLRPREERG